jgi:hypothetical protein
MRRYGPLVVAYAIVRYAVIASAAIHNIYDVEGRNRVVDEIMGVLSTPSK